MPWINEQAAHLDADWMLTSLVADDVPGDLLRVIGEGWAERDGAHVLVAWHDSYYGSRDRFRSARAYESSVNGRAIPDSDLLTAESGARESLLRRGMAFGWTALRQQSIDLPGLVMISEVSLAPMLFDAATWTGNVTFYTAESSVDWPSEYLSGGDEVVVLLRTEECLAPLRASTCRGSETPDEA